MQEPLSGSSILSRVANDLKAARMQRGLSLDETSRILSIQKSHLEKLEAGDFTFFPGAYVLAYIKEYLHEMGLGDEDLLDSCRKELSVSTGLKRHAVPEGAAREAARAFGTSKLQLVFDFVFSRRKSMALVAGALLLAAVFAIVFRFLPSREARLSTVPAAPAELLPDSSSVPSAAESVEPALPAVAASLPAPVAHAAVPAHAKLPTPPPPVPVDAAAESRSEELAIPPAPAQ
ncbi:conserved hypothetical protein [Pelodictyon luteolum DSM 273]|uniref:Helix-turn-helix domain-containing protein n=2 Tax=Pelodictyon luteolum TaxID=1100 RepID=Q3B6B0_CHLL3|nr:conserved hypothetical protein [Pelodictyon luteolum DSM 273]